MEDFLKQFKNNLENRPEPAYEERDWLELEKSLYKKGGTRPPFMWWWVALPLFLLLVLSNGFFYHELNNANEKISILENHYEKVIHQSDTVYVSNIVFQTDTIYQTRTVHKYINDYAANNFYQTKNLPFTALKTKEPSSIESKTPNSQLDSITEPANKNGNSKLSVIRKEAQIQSTEFLEKIGVLEIPYLNPYKEPLPELPSKNALSEKKKKLRHYLYAMQPKDFQLGATFGGARPLSKGLKSMDSFSTGLEAMAGFNSNLQMWVNTSYKKLRFSSTAMKETNGVPVVLPPTPAHTFQSAELPMNVLEFSFGMQYNFSDKKKMNPFIGIGLGASSLLPYQISYDFKDSNDLEFVFEKDMNGTGFIPGLLFIRAGISHEFLPNWSYLLRASYRHNLEEPEFRLPRAYEIQAGLMYHF